MYWNEIRDVLIDGMMLGDDGGARAAVFFASRSRNQTSSTRSLCCTFRCAVSFVRRDGITVSSSGTMAVPLMQTCCVRKKFGTRIPLRPSAWSWNNSKCALATHAAWIPQRTTEKDPTLALEATSRPFYVRRIRLRNKSQTLALTKMVSWSAWFNKSEDLSALLDVYVNS